MQKLTKKLVEVMKECRYVTKNGTNDFHHYNYATSADVLEKVNGALTKNGIASIATPNLLSSQDVTTAKGNIEHLSTVEITVDLIDCESGEKLTIKGLGSGQDAGDKSIMKAQTAALKYCYLLSLAIATGDDPESDTTTDESTSGNHQPPQTNSRSSFHCHDCGAEITQRVSEYSKSKFGKFLCLNCQKNTAKVA